MIEEKPKERNKQIVKAYKQGYSQYIIAKVLGISQPTTVNGVIRGVVGELLLSPDLLLVPIRPRWECIQEPKLPKSIHLYQSINTLIIPSR